MWTIWGQGLPMETGPVGEFEKIRFVGPDLLQPVDAQGINKEGRIEPGYEIRWYRFGLAHAPRTDPLFLIFPDRSTAYEFLRRLQGYDPDRAIFRHILSIVAASYAINRIQEEMVLELLAGSLVNGSLVVGIELIERLRAVVAPLELRSSTPASISAPPLPMRPRERREVPPPEDDPLLESLDILVQVEALKRAAKSGIPFCEECEKNRLRRERVALAGVTK